MSFDTIEYWIFLLVSLPIVFVFSNRLRWLPLVVFSYAFYGYHNYLYCLLLLVSTIIDYNAAKFIESSEQKSYRKAWLLVSIISNVSILVIFKILSALEGQHVGDLSNGASDLLIPIGISFYTFQTISYSIDVYRNEVQASRHFGEFAAFVSFFPQLIAGPIERYNHLSPQLKTSIKLNWENISAGSKILIYGLFKKLVIADNIITCINHSSFFPDAYGGNIVIWSSILMGIWVYIEFSAYTDLAIGSAKLLGVNLTQNFKRPLFAKSITDLWRRWHITLTNWVYNYVYKPLRKSNTFISRRSLSTLIVFSIIGIWHGFNLNYLVFGLYWAVIIILERRLSIPLYGRLTSFLRHIKTFTLWVFGVGFIFYSSSINDIAVKATQLTNPSSHWGDVVGFSYASAIIGLIGIMVVFVLDLLNKNDLVNPINKIRYRVIRWGVYYAMIFSIIMFSQQNSTVFAYFQF